MSREASNLWFLVSLLFSIEVILADEIFPDALDLPEKPENHNCFFRCLALKCNSGGPDSIKTCSRNSECNQRFANLDCKDDNCRKTCGGEFTASVEKEIPLNFTAEYADEGYNPNKIEVNWDDTENSLLYIVQYRIATDALHSWAIGGKASIATGTSRELAVDIPQDLCLELEFRIASVHSDGIFFSPVQSMKKPTPKMRNPGFEWVSTRFEPNYGITARSDGRKGTNPAALIIEAKPKYPKYWDESDIWFRAGPLLDDRDLSVFALPQCNWHASHKTVNFYPQNGTIEFVIQGLNNFHPETSCDCPFILSLSIMRSRKCDNFAKVPTSKFNFNYRCSGFTPRPENCNCIAKYPFCHHKATVKSIVLKNGREIPYNEETGLEFKYKKEIATKNVTVRIEWTKGKDPNPANPTRVFSLLYYAVKYGTPNSLHLTDEIDKELTPSSIDQVIRSEKICENRPIEQCKNTSLLTGLSFNGTFAVSICAVQRNLTKGDEEVLKEAAATSFSLKFAPPPSKQGTIVMAIVIPLAIALIFFVLVVSCLVRRTAVQRRKMEQLNADFNRERDDYLNRYTELPKKNDVWELDRKKLIIYEDQKLGSGAFGSVFKGKVVGKLKAHKDAESNLATYLMKIENSDVAVKMLPEYADDLSKADFLKEINLMKNLGHHERLVNMLACTTESEPYCLIVEFCSDGDLLHFLRDRRKYMMKLDELGIDYRIPGEEVDPDMVLSLKELLAFSLQISYGLEYLSSKGYIHRDVAARNVLVHEKRYAKIGDFGLCRYVLGGDTAYWGKGGRLPIKWMAPEAIKNYEFSINSDIWSFGVLLFEIITMGGAPYPGIQPADMESYLEEGGRMEKPDNCPDNFYDVMMGCWEAEPEKRLKFGETRQKLASQLEEVTSEYSYLNLDSQRDYYNVSGSEYRTDEGVLDETAKHQVDAKPSDVPESGEATKFSFDFPQVVVESPNSPALNTQLSIDSHSATIVNETGSRKVSSESLSLPKTSNASQNSNGSMEMVKVPVCKTDSGFEAKGSDSVSMSSTEASPPALRKRAAESTTSDFQLTPVKTDRHFSFSNSKGGAQNPFLNGLDEIVETSDGTITSGDDAISPGFTNPLYTDFGKGPNTESKC